MSQKLSKVIYPESKIASDSKPMNLYDLHDALFRCQKETPTRERKARVTVANDAYELCSSMADDILNLGLTPSDDARRYACAVVLKKMNQLPTLNRDYIKARKTLATLAITQNIGIFGILRELSALEGIYCSFWKELEEKEGGKS